MMATVRGEGHHSFFRSKLVNTRRSCSVFDQHRRPSGEGLAFGHSSCDNKSSASRRNLLTTSHPSGQRLAGVSDIALEDAGVYSTLKAAATVLVLPTMSTMHHLASRS